MPVETGSKRTWQGQTGEQQPRLWLLLALRAEGEAGATIAGFVQRHPGSKDFYAILQKSKSQSDARFVSWT